MALLRSFLLFIALTVNEVKAEISASSELNCDFGTACRWRNSTEDGGDFLTTMVLDTDAVTKISPMRDGDQTPFAYTAGFMGRTMAMLVSEVINCQLGGASLKYWYYKTGHESQLEVCIRQPPGSREPASLRCYDGVSSTFAKQWIFRAVELPPIAQPFEIVFRAFYFPPTDVIAIDDVIFDAALCESSNGGNSEGAGGTFGENPVEVAQLADFEGNDLTLDAVRFETAASSPQTSRPVNFAAPTDSRKAAIGTKRPKASELSAPRSGAVYTPKCPAVDCDFNDGTLCSYVTSSGNLSTSTSIDGNNLRPWAVTSRSVLNSLTGVPHDLSKGGSFAFAKGTSPSEVFILSSDKLIEISEPARLDFFVYQAGTRGQLKVCIDDDTNCPLQLFGEDIDVDSQKWKNYYVDVPTGKHVFHFIVDGLFENYVIGIDNIQLLNRFGAASFPCP